MPRPERRDHLQRAKLLLPLRCALGLKGSVSVCSEDFARGNRLLPSLMAAPRIFQMGASVLIGLCGW